MARGWIHTVYKAGSWLNEVEGEGSASALYDTKAAAVAAGRELAIARRTEHVIHNENGTISGRNSYGNDPYPPPG